MYLPESSGYEYIDTPEGPRYLDQRTGHLCEIINFQLPEGTSYMTPAQRDVARSKKEQRQRKTNRAIAGKHGGDFYFLFAKEALCNLPPEMLTRLIFLATFLSYGSNKLVFDNGKPIKRRDLPELLNVSGPLVTVMMKTLSPKYIVENDNKEIILNNDYFYRGALTKEQKEDPFQRLFRAYIRKLYKETEPRQHKHLGYVLAMIPLINLEYNILCSNPHETNIDLIDTVTLSEFCEIIGYSTDQLSRLAKIYKSMTFDVRGERQRFVSFINDGDNIGESSIIINPKILYAGTHPEKVEVLCAGFQ